MPHHSQRNPERHSAETQFFLQTAHFELLGRLPSRQWWVCFTCAKSFPGKYVAFSLQSATAKSWHSVCTKYSHTEITSIIDHCLSAETSRTFQNLDFSLRSSCFVSFYWITRDTFFDNIAPILLASFDKSQITDYWF